MADLVFNIAKGRVGAYCQNVKDGTPSTSRLKAIPIETSGLETPETLKDHDNLSVLLAGTSNEQTTMGRKTILAADITLTVDDTTGTGNKLNIDMADITWAAATGNAVSGLLIVYCPDGTTPGPDTSFIPLTFHDFVVTPDGSTITASINAAGFFSAV